MMNQTITQSASLPSRDQWWMEIGAILEGNIVEVTLQKEMTLDAPAGTAGEKQQPHLLDSPGSQPLLLVCQSGGRSARAALLLTQMGFDKAVNLRGGMIAYQMWQQQAA